MFKGLGDWGTLFYMEKNISVFVHKITGTTLMGGVQLIKGGRIQDMVRDWTKPRRKGGEDGGRPKDQ